VILILKQGVSPEEKEQLRDLLRSENYRIKEIEGVEETIIGVVGTIQKDIRYFETGVRQIYG